MGELSTPQLADDAASAPVLMVRWRISGWPRTRAKTLNRGLSMVMLIICRIQLDTQC